MTQATKGKRKKTKTGRQADRAGVKNDSGPVDPGSSLTILGLSPPPAMARTTKTRTCLDLLKRRKGASMEELREATGWQAHSVRGFLSGTVKKKLGFDVTSKQVGNRGRVYQASPGQ